MHNSPRFRRDPQGIYSQLVYSTKSSDVSDVMVNGKWLMRHDQLTTLNQAELIQQADAYANRIDAFLIQREKSVLSKLITIEGALEEESFEVQSKTRLSEPDLILQAFENPEIDILYHRHYHEYDTYFLFEDPSQGTLRYREDEFIEDDQKIDKVRYRLTLIGPTREHKFPSDVLLSRSRYLATASHSLRFYREYFKPSGEVFVEKDRLRWRVLFQGTEFYVNLDRIEEPDLGYFLEVKSRTWSLRDAEHKARVATLFLEFLGISIQQRVEKDYLELAQGD